MVSGHVELVVCAAPLAHHAARLAAAVLEGGWSLSVVASSNAEAWLDTAALTKIVGKESLVVRPRAPDEARRRPRPSAVIAAPATFNTLNKLRAGISDTAALGALNDAVGSQVPLLVVPMVSDRLAGHPAWIETFDWLARAGISVLDPTHGHTGSTAALASGTGDSIAATFDARLLTDWLRRV